jgi:anti-anti-sigma factor
MTVSDVEVLQGEPGSVIVRFIGEHDLTTREPTDAVLARLVGDNDLVTVDLGETTFIDSSFMHSIVKADRSARDRGARIRVRLGTHQGVEQALRLAGLLEQLDCVPPQDETTLPPVPPPDTFTRAVTV